MSVAGLSEAVWHGGSRRTKNLQGEREREGREESERKKRRRKGEERKERKGEEQKTERCIMGVKYPLELSKKLIKDTQRGGREKTGKRQKKRQKRQEKI